MKKEICACGHPIDQHNKYVGCMFFSKEDKYTESNGYCACKLKHNQHYGKPINTKVK